jgi:hypothetical protein
MRQFKTVQHHLSEEFDSRVLKLLEDGWCILGQPFAFDGELCVCMTKYEGQDFNQITMVPNT